MPRSSSSPFLTPASPALKTVSLECCLFPESLVFLPAFLTVAQGPNLDLNLKLGRFGFSPAQDMAQRETGYTFGEKQAPNAAACGFGNAG